MAHPGEWTGEDIHESFADCTKFASKANIVVATYSLQAGVSIESHFQLCFPLFYTWVGDFSAANQVTLLGVWSRYQDDVELTECVTTSSHDTRMLPNLPNA